MTKDEINKTIHEELFGECWHEWVKVCYQVHKCLACGNLVADPNRCIHPDYTSDAMFLPVFRKAKEKEWWYRFFEFYKVVEAGITEGWDGFDQSYYILNYDKVDQPIFAKTLAEWLSGEGDK